MERGLTGKRPSFHQERQGNRFYHVMGLLILIVAGVWILASLRRGQIDSPFAPTPTPTRNSESFFLEAQAYFDAGVLDNPSNATPGPGVPKVNDAIDAYKAALEGDPNNALAWAYLARIQTYSSNMLRNDTERLARLQEAKQSADRAIALEPDSSEIRAIRAFVLDWYAFNPLVPDDQMQDLLVEAEREASRAFQLDPENALALAYYAEILADEQKWTQAEKYAAQAVAQDPNSMDTHRVYGYVLETLGKYNSAIQQYQEAVRINPNMTFIYVRIGQNFREGIKNPDRALEYFDRAAKINAGLGIQNPNPYIEIARTYTQLGQFFAASINAEKGLQLDPTNAHTYGQLGIIFRRARNYEGAMYLLKCAVTGCTAAENEMGKTDVQGLPLTSITVAYYYVEYGTNLAFLSRPNENYCPEALQILQQVRDSYSDDPILMGIVEDSEGICRNLAGGQSTTTTAAPQSTGAVVLTGTAAPTGSPLSTVAPTQTPTTP
jgi:tetratricopeptide (TPR) repeat protein